MGNKKRRGEWKAYKYMYAYFKKYIYTKKKIDSKTTVKHFFLFKNYQLSEKNIPPPTLMYA